MEEKRSKLGIIGYCSLNNAQNLSARISDEEMNTNLSVSSRRTGYGPGQPIRIKHPHLTDARTDGGLFADGPSRS